MAGIHYPRIWRKRNILLPVLGPASYGGLYQDWKQMPLAPDAAEINYVLKTVGQEMMKLKSTDVYHTAPVPVGGTPIPSDAQLQITSPGQFVVGFFSHNGKVDTFMIVNRDYKKVSTAMIQLPKNIHALKEFDRKSGKWKHPLLSVHPGWLRLAFSRAMDD